MKTNKMLNKIKKLRSSYFDHDFLGDILAYQLKTRIAEMMPATT